MALAAGPDVKAQLGALHDLELAALAAERQGELAHAADRARDTRRRGMQGRGGVAGDLAGVADSPDQAGAGELHHRDQPARHAGGADQHPAKRPAPRQAILDLDREQGRIRIVRMIRKQALQSRFEGRIRHLPVSPLRLELFRSPPAGA